MSLLEAEALMDKAAKKANSFSWFGGNKQEEAADMYTKAGNAFRMHKKWKEAGEAFLRCAEIQMKMDERDEASTSFVNAYKAQKKSSAEDAARSLSRAIELLTERGRFHTAANYQKDLATLYESDLPDLPKAMDSYQLAADWYSSEDSTALANGCLVKVATYAAQLEKYDKAVEVFEEVASKSLDSQLSRWSCKEYFLKAGLCRLCQEDYVGAHRAIERYQDMDPSFSTTRECKFLKDLLEAVENGDPDAFSAHVQEYDKLTKLDDWKTTILFRMKKGIEGQSWT